MGILLPILYMVVELGISFHYPSYRRGNELIYGDLHNKAEIIDQEETLSLYKVINSPKDVRDFVRIDARLATQIKLDHFDTIRSSIIRSSVTSRETTVEIMVGTRYTRAIEKIPSGLKMGETWKTKKPFEVGTHYVKNFLRGGYFLTSIVFPCENAEKKEKVMKAVLNNLKDSGNFDRSFVEKMEKVKEELGSDYVNFRFGSVNCVGCTFPFFSSLEQLVEVTTSLPDKIKKSGDGYGARILMELEELSKISNFPAYQENSKIIEKLDEIDQLFDDVMIARKEFINNPDMWSVDISAEDEKAVNKFYSKIEVCRREFLHALVNLDISPSASLDQLDGIYKAYGSTDDYHKYEKEYRALRDRIKKNIPK